MRRYILIAAAAALFAAALSSNTLLFELPGALGRRAAGHVAARLRSDGLLAWWNFDGLEVQNAVSGVDARVFGCVRVPGRLGWARAFDGADDTFIETDLDWSRLGDRYSIAARVRLDRGSPPSQSIIARQWGPTTGLLLSEGLMTLAVPGAAGQGAAYRFERFGEFVHLAAVVDAPGKTAVLYEDGEEKARIALAALDAASGPVEFGKLRPFKTYLPFHGALDDVAVWDRALTPREVRRLARSPRSLARERYRRAPAAALAAAGAEAFGRAARFACKLIDLFDPRYHESRLLRAPLPSFRLTLSRADERYFLRARRRRLEAGAATDETRNRRRVEIIAGGVPHPVRMRLVAGGPALWTSPRAAFTLEADDDGVLPGGRRIRLIPPEAAGLLRPLLRREIARREGADAPDAGLATVMINGAFQGLYYWETLPVSDWPLPGDCEGPSGLMERTLLPPGTVLEIYDDLRRSAEPLLKRDRRSRLSAREVRFGLDRDRETIVRAAAAVRGLPPAERAARTASRLSPSALAGDNPSPSFVVRDLRPFGVIPHLSWKSSLPAVISPAGSVFRPEGAPEAVTLETAIPAGTGSLRHSLTFRVMPRPLTLPVVRLLVPETIRNTSRTPCRVELIDDVETGPAHLLPAAVKYRGNTTLYYPKKSLSLRFEEPPGLFPGSDARIVHLISTYADYTLFKNVFVYDLYRSLSGEGADRVAPRTRLVEVFLNGDYRGIYQLTERVDRHLLGFAPDDPKAKRRGALYKAQHYRANFRTPARYAYRQIEPDEDDGPYWKPYDDLIAFLGGAKGERFEREAGEWIDLGSYIDFHLLVNLAGNREGIRYNLYLARDAAPGSPFRVIPWDFDKAFLGDTDFWLSNTLFKKLVRRLPGFRERFRKRWRSLRRGPFTEERLLDRIDRLDALLSPRAPEEFARWPREGPPRDEVVAGMRDWLHRRLEDMDRLIEEM